MNMEQLFKSVLEQDQAPIVLCNPEHTIVYMNPVAAKRYAQSGGYKLVGRSVLDCHNKESREKIEKVLDWFREDENHNKLIGYYEKHEYRNHESGKLYDFGV